MPIAFEVHDDLVDQIWRDLDGQVDRPRIAEIARDIAARLCDATVPTFVPLFVRRLSYELLSAQAAQRCAGTEAAGIDGGASSGHAP